MKVTFSPHHSLNFGAKKVLYTDFDNTYFPFVRTDVSPINAEAFRNMYLPFIKYKRTQGDDFELKIITGRSKENYLHTEEMITNAGLDYCYPVGLVSGNGANVFKIQNGTPINVFPKDDLRAEGVFDDVVKLILDSDKEITAIECRINGNKEYYQEYSSESKLDKLKPEKYISIAKDGKYNGEIVVSKSIDFEKVSTIVKQHIEENMLPFSVETYRDSGFDIVMDYSGGNKKPVAANIIFLKYSPNGTETDKVNIVKHEVEKIQQRGTDDFIIVAGDGYNDAKMLNPLNYINGDKDIENPETLLKLLNLPLRSIICGNDSKLDDLRELAKKLQAKGIEIIKVAPNHNTDFIRAIKDFDKEYENKANINLNLLHS